MGRSRVDGRSYGRSELDQYLWEAWEEMTAPGAPFSWSVLNVRGVPTRAYDSAPPNMAVLWQSSLAHADNDYIVFEDERITYAEAHTRVVALIAHLSANGIGHGDRVAIAMRNYPEWVLSYWAIISLGAAVVGMNAWWTGSEMEFGLSDCGARALICDGERLERVRPVLTDLREEGRLHVVVVRSEGILPDDAVHWDDSLAKRADLPTPPDVQINPEDDVCIFYTSGTTGRPKGAALTHRGAVSNLLNMAFWQVTTEVAEAKAIAAGTPPSGSHKEPGESEPGSLLAVPLFHVTGCNCCLHPVTASGGKLVLMYRWSAEKALELIERERVSSFTGVPTMARELINSPDFAKRDTSSLAHLGGGGAAVQPDLVHKIEEHLEGRPSTGYGLTEVNGVITINSAHWFLAKPESAGPPLPIMEAHIRDDEGTTLPAGSTGQLWVRGANVFRGYLNRPEANAEVLIDGWFDTGDIGYLDDDGFLFLVDRAKDMVLRGGENVYSAEVEAAIYEHPAVAEVAVFAVPDERLGEAVGVAIVLLPGVAMTVEDLRAHTAELIASFKVPEHVWFLTDPIPRNANGKFVKRQLRESLLGSTEG
ncbi:MAG TPA: AMP-dependent synthetase [Acidimicrobiaceae bacterium]|nr:AMP-dependent synthetase [Acidimicrobiaceae bacterium]MDP7258337.1 class I adenylate-forming enzyme family protein [Acidimicrobiales bacterium]HCV36899.1 AMP-dependent synthetase [Acidimicrobiaceae bacterium]HJO79947.1 class I adenylate-forming enzyme family protein [Acidimicrobiales bacterium]